MKKRVVICLIGIVGAIFTIIIASNNQKEAFLENGVMVAVNVDGVVQNAFPPKGQYKVDVDCSGAKGNWDYDNWKLDIKSINNNISCDISFDTLETTYLNTYVTNLTGTTQGNGELIHEIGSKANYTNPTILSQNDYLNTSMFSNTQFSTKNGTEESEIFTYSSNKWITNPSKMTSDKYYHFKFNVLEEGFYQVCYTMGMGHTSNQLYVYKNNVSMNIPGSSYTGLRYDAYYLSASTSAEKNGCIDLGYVTPSDDVRIVERAYTDIATLSFRVEKGITDTFDTGFRYEGKDPSNYIWFNNELWRIIGVFDSSSHGQSGKNLVKIIKNDSIGGITWDKSGKSNWSTSSLKALLNGAYYNKQDGTASGYCYGYSSTITTNCNFSATGIDSSYRGMIVNAKWNLGGFTPGRITTDELYTYERDATSKYDTNPASDTGYIGLMYASDYGYATPESDCSRTTRIETYYSCKTTNWLYTNGFEWTITPSNNSNVSFNIYTGGKLTTAGTGTGYAVRPVLYLDSSAYLLDGDGSMGNPYIIGM